LTAGRAWELASRKIAAATGFDLVATRDFLDSSRGRHFADEVANGLAIGKPIEAAIDAAVAQWMSWRIGARLERETGIPRGLPYLTGWVGNCAAQSEPA
jgi:hypothetical protein